MNLNRRNFLFGSAAAVTLAGCATAKTGARELKEGEKFNLAVIGWGMQGRTLASQIVDPNLVKNAKITVMCDCDRTRAKAGAKWVDEQYAKQKIESSCKSTVEFFDVIFDDSIDGVVIATPDHWHAYLAVEAMKHGKDVYCEKPMTFSIEEAKKVIAAQAKYGRVFQNGSMQRSWREFRDAVSLVRGGLIGDVMYVDANYGRGGQKLGGPSHPVRFFDVPADAAKESEGYEDLTEWGWNRWLGPAAYRPYSNQLAPHGDHRFYPMFWRFDDDIGSGYNGDWGAHHLDIAQWGLDMDKDGPVKVICSKEPHSTDLFHGGRRQFGMKMIFRKPYGDVELYHGPFGVWGTVFYGTKGIVAVNRGKIAVWVGGASANVKPDAKIREQLQDAKNLFAKEAIFVESIGADYGTDATVKTDNKLASALDKIEKTYANVIAAAGLYNSPNQVQNFCECMETRKPTISPAEVGGRGATLCLLCNMSYKYDASFDWDGKKMEIKGENPKGISIRRESYRDGWDIIV